MRNGWNGICSRARNGFFRRMLKEGGFHPIRELRLVAMNCMQPQVMASGDVVFAAGPPWSRERDGGDLSVDLVEIEINSRFKCRYL